MDNFSPGQYDRFEAYRRHALPKQAVRKVCIFFISDLILTEAQLNPSRSFNKLSGNKSLNLLLKSLQGFLKCLLAKSSKKVCQSCNLLFYASSSPCALHSRLTHCLFAARAVQARRGETGPLSPDHLREAYRAYQEETGRVGAARPLRAKKYFVR